MTTDDAWNDAVLGAFFEEAILTLNDKVSRGETVPRRGLRDEMRRTVATRGRDKRCQFGARMYWMGTVNAKSNTVLPWELGEGRKPRCSGGGSSLLRSLNFFAIR
jgi:hypothetical protein